MTGIKITNWVSEHGDGIVARRGEILRTTVGSEVHGIAIAGTDDHDEMGVYLEPKKWVLGVQDHRDNYVARTQPEGARSGHGDTDLVLYSLRKFLRLAVKGNPTVLVPLFAPDAQVLHCTDDGHSLRDSRHWFLSQQAIERFLGYMHAQHERMLGLGKRNRVPARPELIEKYGWDVKYGSHALRLAWQGWELATTGGMELPMPATARSEVLSVKRGEVPRDEVSDRITALEREVRRMLDAGTTALRPEPNIAAIEGWAADTQMWAWQGWLR